MYTLDANIFVRDIDVRAAEHQTCRDLLVLLHQRHILVMVPWIVQAEVAGAISREFRDPVRGRLAGALLIELPFVQLRTIDPNLGQIAADIAADYGLRGMDAIYVAVAQQTGSCLVTLDAEVRRRAATLIPVQTPAETLAALRAAPDPT